ncbi:thermonuclease family protein [[Clostridium] innocuum]|nr:thermonuclease family protein [[Clostridium] innocuum]
MKKNIRRIIIVSAIVLSAALPGLKMLQPLEQEGVKLTKCTDGDTAHFMIDGQDTTVRFLAIDTPETIKPNTPVQPYGKEASQYTCDALNSAKEIRLEYEKEKNDKYGRNLAWVFVDDKLLQEQLIQKGYAKVAYLYGDYKYTGRLQEAEKKAKAERLGIWSLK